VQRPSDVLASRSPSMVWIVRFAAQHAKGGALMRVMRVVDSCVYGPVVNDRRVDLGLDDSHVFPSTYVVCGFTSPAPFSTTIVRLPLPLHC